MPSPRVVRVAQLITSFELLPIIAITPVLLFPTPGRVIVLAVVPLLWISARIGGEPIVPATPMNTALWMLLSMVGVTLLVTIDVVLSLGKVCGVLLGVLLFWSIVRWLDTPARLKIAAVAFVFAGAGLAVIGLLGANWDNKFAAIGAITGRIPEAIRGVPGAEGGFNTNAVGGCLILFIPLQIGLLTAQPGWLFSGRAGNRRLVILEVLLLMLTAGTLVLTESRTAWISLGVAGVVFLVWYRRWTQVLVTTSAVALATLIAFVGTDPLWDFIVSRSGPAFVSTFDLRMKLWSIGLTALQDYKFTGMGLNVFRKLLPIRYPGYPALPGEEISHAHNHLLQAGLDLGVPGLIAYLAIWIIAGVLLVQVYRRSAQSSFRVLAGGLGAGLVAHFVFGMADVIPLGAKVGVLFWLTLAFTVALHRVALTRSG